jgi:hypothetical protein
MEKDTLIINDSDGHAHAIKLTPENLQKCFKMFLESDMAFNEGVRDDKGVVEEYKHLVEGEPNGEELYDLLWRFTDRSNGGFMYFVDLDEEWDFPYNPFT